MPNQTKSSKTFDVSPVKLVSSLHVPVDKEMTIVDVLTFEKRIGQPIVKRISLSALEDLEAEDAKSFENQVTINQDLTAIINKTYNPEALGDLHDVVFLCHR